MDKRSYPNFTREDVNKVRRELGKFGIKIPDGDDVEVKGPLGVKMRVVYDEPNQTLSLTILDKPGFVSEAQIWKVIESSAGKQASRGD
jgi:hypothetical protein